METPPPSTGGLRQFHDERRLIVSTASPREAAAKRADARARRGTDIISTASPREAVAKRADARARRGTDIISTASPREAAAKGTDVPARRGAYGASRR